MSKKWVQFVSKNDYFVSFFVPLPEGDRINSGIVSFVGPLNATALNGLAEAISKDMGLTDKKVVIINVQKLEPEDE